jgi:predicted DNA-binding transcriptional regulator AlpA
MEANTPDRLVSFEEVKTLTTLDRRTVHRLVSEGRFPAPARLSVGRVAFLESSVRAWVASRIEATSVAAARV